MKNRVFSALNTLGWLMVFTVLLMFSVYCVASDDDLYFRLQSEAGILDSAGISEADLRMLDARLSDGLFAPRNADTAFDNREIEVFGRMQPPFNERELTHLYDCRRLLSPLQPGALYAFMLLAAVLLLSCGGKNFWRRRFGAAWIAAGLILLPIAALGIWAALDFGGAFTFFHEMLFTNDLWLLDPATDLLIRICPSSMFAAMGLRIGLYFLTGVIALPILARGAVRVGTKLREAKKGVLQ